MNFTSKLIIINCFNINLIKCWLISTRIINNNLRKSRKSKTSVTINNENFGALNFVENTSTLGFDF